MARILIIDDDEDMCYTLSGIARHEGHHTSCAYNLGEGKMKASQGAFDLVFLDVMMPDGNGLDALPKIRKASSRPEVIIITAEGDPDGAEMAIRNGAWDYLQKPFTIKEMQLSLLRALQFREAEKIPHPTVSLKRKGIIGEGPAIRSCFELVGQAAQSDNNVLITGETGTGKELFATAIHNNSVRRPTNFVVVDCAALPETLVASVLFGHQKGAFTGAEKPHEGLIMQAHGGTLFLDEVGELPPAIQRAFLRVLQEHRFRPVGGKGEIESHFRCIAATNRDLDEMVKAGSFRNDLLFRLRSSVINLPPLRERKEDIRELAMYFMSRFCDRHGIATKGFSPEFIESLVAYHWPGNVRELINTMESILTTEGDAPVFFPKHLPTAIRVQVARDSLRERPKSPKDDTTKTGTFRDFRQKAVFEAEKKYLINLISLNRSDMKRACRVSGLSPSRLYALLKKHQLT